MSLRNREQLPEHVRLRLRRELRRCALYLPVEPQGGLHRHVLPLTRELAAPTRRWTCLTGSLRYVALGWDVNWLLCYWSFIVISLYFVHHSCLSELHTQLCTIQATSRIRQRDVRLLIGRREAASLVCGVSCGSFAAIKVTATYRYRGRPNTEPARPDKTIALLTRPSGDHCRSGTPTPVRRYFSAVDTSRNICIKDPDEGGECTSTSRCHLSHSTWPST